MGFCQRVCNRVFQPPLQLRGVGFPAMAGNRAVSSHPRSTSGCFGTSGRVSDWPQDFGGQGGVVAGADSTPGSYYLSASPGALALACSAGLAGQRLAGRAEPPAPRRKGGRRRPGRNLAPGAAGIDLLGASPVSPRCWGLGPRSGVRPSDPAPGLAWT